SSTVAAKTNRTIPMLATRMSRIVPPNRPMTMMSPIVSSASSGTRMNSARPGSARRSQVRAMAVMPTKARERFRARRGEGGREHGCERRRTYVSSRAQRATNASAASKRSLVDAAHDWIQRGHDRHRVSKQIAGQERSDGLEVDEAGVVDLEPERLVGAVADGVRAEQPARRLDGGPGATRPWPEEPRQLGHDRPVGHLLEALVDDPQALLDLLHPEQVARQRIAFRPGRDVELELRVDRVGMGPSDVERDARGAQVRAGHAEPQRGLAVDDAEAAGAPDEDLVLVQEGRSRLDLANGAAHPVPEAAQELVVEVAVHPADAEVVEQHPLAGQRRQHLDDLVALDERPQDRRQATEVQREPAEEQGMARDPVQLTREHPDVLGAPGHLDVEEPLVGGDGCPLHEQRRDVLERVHLADRLVIVGVLDQLLDAA